MFAHDVEGTRAVTRLDGLLDDQVLAVADDNPVQRPADPVAGQDLAHAAVRHHLQPAQAVHRLKHLSTLIVSG